MMIWFEFFDSGFYTQALRRGGPCFCVDEKKSCLWCCRDNRGSAESRCYDRVWSSRRRWSGSTAPERKGSTGSRSYVWYVLHITVASCDDGSSWGEDGWWSRWDNHCVDRRDDENPTIWVPVTLVGVNIFFMKKRLARNLYNGYTMVCFLG